MEASDYEIKPGAIYRSAADFQLVMYPTAEDFDIDSSMSDTIKPGNYVLVLEIKTCPRDTGRNYCKILLLRVNRVGWLSLDWMDKFDEAQRLTHGN